MTFSPVHIDGTGTINVFDIATSACPGATVGATVAGGDVHGLYTSTTSPIGNLWNPQGKGIGAGSNYNRVAAVLWSRRESNTVYAATGDKGAGGGLLASADGGVTWAPRSTVPQFAGNDSAIPVPVLNYARSTGRLLVQDTGSSWLFAATYQQGVLRSANSGTDNFPVAITMTGGVPGTGNWFCRALAQQPGTPTTLYLAAYDSSKTTGAVWKCYATGAGGPHGTSPNFTKLAASPPTPEDLLVLANGNVYAACGFNGVYRSTDGGTTWTPKTGVTSLNAAGFDISGASYWFTLDGYTDGSGNDVILAGASNPLVNAAGAVSLTIPAGWTTGTGSLTYANLAGTVQTTTMPDTGAGHTCWYSASTLVLGKGAWAKPFLRFDPNDGTHAAIYASGSMGCYRSANGGSTWTVSGNGIPGFTAPAVCADPLTAGHVTFTASDWTCFDDTTPGTENATTLNCDPPVGSTKGYCLAADPTDATVYIGSQQAGGFKFSNGHGQVYQRAWNAPSTWTVVGGSAPNDFFTVAGGNQPIGLCALRDAGANKVLLAAAWGGGLYRWTAALGWVQVSAAISASSNPLGNYVPFAHVPGSAYVYVFDAKTGVWRSGDYGATWTSSPIWSVTSSNNNSAEIAAHPLTAGELWVTVNGSLYQLTGAQTGTFTSPAANTGVTNAGPVAISSAGTIYVATLDTGSGTRLLQSTTDGATWASAADTVSFPAGNSAPTHISVGSDGRLYISGPNVVLTGFPSAAGPVSAAFTEVQTGLNASGTGAITLMFGQAGGTGSALGSALVARLELNDCSVTVTPPNANWVLVSEGKAGTLTGQARVQVWVNLNNTGGLGAPPPPQPAFRGTGRRQVPGRRRMAQAAGTAGGIPVGLGTPQVFTLSGGTAKAAGKLHEYTTPAGTIQFLDHPLTPAAGGAGAVASATSLPVTAGAANTAAGGLGLAVFGALLTSPAGQSWTVPASWSNDGFLNNQLNVFDCVQLPADSAGTTSVTGLITLGTSTMTSWAAAVCTLYALAASPAEITTVTLPAGSTTAAYTATMAATGGAPPYTWTVTSGTLPTGLSLSSAGVITGTPSAPGTYTFTITVTDTAAQTDSDPFSITITAPSTLAITPVVLPADVAGVPYAFTLAATGGTP